MTDEETINELRTNNEDLQTKIESLERLNRNFEAENDRLDDEIKDLKDELNQLMEIEPAPEFTAMLDQMKYEFFMENFEKITQEQLQSLLP